MLNMKYYQYYYKKFENIWKIAVIIHRKSCLIPNIFFQRYNKLYSLPENAIFQAKSWKKIYTTVLQINHETFQDFIDEQKFSLINISLKENFLEKVRVIFFFWKYIVTRMKRYFNDGQQWKKLLQNENLYQVLGNECFDKFFIEHQLFRKQHCARAISHVSYSVCVAKKLRVVQVIVILRCFSSSQKVRTKCERKFFFFFWKFKKQFFS